jgi:hypothetical protein
MLYYIVSALINGVMVTYSFNDETKMRSYLEYMENTAKYSKISFTYNIETKQSTGEYILH